MEMKYKERGNLYQKNSGEEEEGQIKRLERNKKQG